MAVDSLMIARIAQLIECTEAEGPGRRFAIWFQGCPLRCPGCCNPEMLPFVGGEEVAVDYLMERIRVAQLNHQIEGVSLLGGEPFAHSETAAAIARAAQSLQLSVMIYSGYTLEELKRSVEPTVATLLSHCDVLVDGPYMKDLPEPRRRWVGSSNQQVHYLTDRYSEEDPCWRKPNSIEIRLRDGQLSVNGFPAANAVGLWRRPKTIEAS